jgi:hypothetical protein
MVKKQAAQAGGRLVRNIAEEVGEQLTRRPKPAAPGSDWGWRGAKPGEISGGQFLKDHPVGSKEAFDWQQRFAKQIDPINYAELEPHQMANIFDSLERADIPRAWTGKVVENLGLNFYNVPALSKMTKSRHWTEARSETAKYLSQAMRPLSNEGREMLLKMLPSWEGSLDDLASTISAILM